MVQVRQFHNLTLATARADSDRVCYLIMPEGESKKILDYIDSASEKYNCSMVVLSALNWNDDLTPWPAPGVFKQKKPFGGKAATFLKAFLTEYMRDIEQALGLSHVQRYLVGVSLSGLFALWAMTQTDKLAGVASISGSLWYDGFVQWLQQQEFSSDCKTFLCLGDSEHKSKESRMATVQQCTEAVVAILQQKGVDTTYKLVPGTHFSDIKPRLDQAFDSLLG